MPEAQEEVFRIAYDIENKKVGCVLIQAALSCTVPSELFHAFFGDVNCWTVNASRCLVYPITEAQLPMLVDATDFAHHTEKEIRT